MQLGLSGYGGAYLPLSNLFAAVRVRPDTAQPIVLNLGQEPGLLAGGRLTVRLSRLAVEAEVGYGFSDLDLPTEAGGLGDASVVLGSLNLLYDVIQAPFSPLSLFVSGGAGFLSRGGDFFDAFDGTTDIAGVLGLGVRIGLGGVTYLRFDIRDYISSFAPEAGGFQFDSKVQNDLLATLALELVFAPAR